MSTQWNTAEHFASPFAPQAEAWAPADLRETSDLPYEAPGFQSFDEVAGPVSPALVAEASQATVHDVARLRLGHESLERETVRRAVAGGDEDPGRLTNLVFFARHPARGVRSLARSEPGFAELAAEWETIHDTIVRPLLNPAQSTWLEAAPDELVVAEQDAVPAHAENRTPLPAFVASTVSSRSPVTSVEAWAALARALLSTGYETGTGRDVDVVAASTTLEEQVEAELPYPSGGMPSSVENAIIKAEIGKGVVNENVLTDLVFYRRYPARNRRPLSSTEPDYHTLSQEWLRIRDTQVRPMLNSQSPPVGRPYVRAPSAGSPGGAALPLPRAAIGQLSELQDPHHDYPAIDLQAPNGTPIYAVVGGTVQLAGDAGGFGPHAVYLKDGNGYTWIYGHGSAHCVTVGQRVVAGHHIADVGSLGQSSGPHLHLEIKDSNNVKYCPQRFLTALWNGQTPPPVGSLPTGGCSY